MVRICKKSASTLIRLLLLVSTLLLLTLTQAKGSSGGGGAGGGRSSGGSSSSSSGGSRSSSSSSSSSSSKSSAASGSTSSSSSKAAPAVGSAGKTSTSSPSKLSALSSSGSPPSKASPAVGAKGQKSSSSPSKSSASSGSTSSSSKGVPAVGKGAGGKPASNSYVPRSYTGPVRTTANGATAPVTPLTASRPRGGAYYALPAYTSSQYRYTRNRPLLHTYPFGYTLLFIPFYSAAYTGNHWAVYNQEGQFWGYDDGDVTTGDYDYDDGDGLPSGCQLSTPQAASSEGVLNLASANFSAPAPAPAPGSANRSASAQQPRQLLCMPLAATVQTQPQGFWTKGHIILVAVICSIAGILLVAVLACCICKGCCSCGHGSREIKQRPQIIAGKVHQPQAPASVWDGATKQHKVEQVVDSNCRV